MTSLPDLIKAIDQETAALSVIDPVGPEAQADQAAAAHIRFFLDQTLLAVPMASCVEISRIQQVTPLPNLPDWILGVTNIRGDIVSVVDLKAYLSLGPAVNPRGSTSLWIIQVRNTALEADAITLGLTVDKVAGMFHLDPRVETQSIASPQSKTDEPPFIKGTLWPKDAGLKDETRPIYLLDVEALLASSQMTAFRAQPIQGDN